MIIDHATIDFETYYDQEFSLSKLQTDEYILDSRFELIGVSVKASRADDVVWFSGDLEDTKKFLEAQFEWSKTVVCCQNTNFDGFIATQVLGLKPRLWMDTLGMARVVYPWWPRYGLARIAENLGVGMKGTAVSEYRGYRREDFTEAQLHRYGEYCKNDTALTFLVSQLLLTDMPVMELAIIDMSVRMFTEPSLCGDRAGFIAYHKKEVARKEALIAACVTNKDNLMSNLLFAEKLKELGIIPPMKLSPTTGEQTYAFAKTDKGLTALLDHEDGDVQALVAARIGAKSTIAETRARRFIQASGRGKLPVYINHWGAKKTGRMSAGNKMNWLNIPARGDAKQLRRCITAPDGYKVVVGDSSAIELRVCVAAAGATKDLQALQDGEDLYCLFASEYYGREITKADKKERAVGKVGRLSLQYGSGAETFVGMVRSMTGQHISLQEARAIVSLYRRLHPDIPAFWRHCERVVMPAIANGDVLQSVDMAGWALTTPNGFAVPGLAGVQYKDLHKDGEGNWKYRMNNGDVYLYGGKMVENVCQHLARQIVLWQTLRVHRRYPVALSVYDEIVCVVPDEQVEDCREYMQQSLAMAPAWCDGDIPLEGEVEVGDNYGDAK